MMVKQTKTLVGSVDCVVVLVTCPSVSVATRLAKTLVSRRLIACANIVPGVTSFFWWDGKVDRAREAMLLLRTTRAGEARLRHAVRSLHPYEVPEIIALPIVAGHQPYLRWVMSSVASR